MKNIDFQKSKLLFQTYIETKAEDDHRWLDVIKAYRLAEETHTGFRKDGITPILQHQLSICLYLKTISAYFNDPIEVFVLALLHDVYEDHPEKIQTLYEDFPEYYEKVKTLSKKTFLQQKDGVVLPLEDFGMIKGAEIVEIGKEYPTYFKEIFQAPSCSLVKLTDRLHNSATMIGVFSKEKMLSYVQEIEVYFLPSLKNARKLYPFQRNAYENLKSVLLIQLETVKGLLES